jgi:PHD-zinc-finger like domain/PHD-finger
MCDRNAVDHAAAQPPQQQQQRLYTQAEVEAIVAAALCVENVQAQGEQREQASTAAPPTRNRKRGLLPPPSTADTVEEVAPPLRKRGLLPPPVTADAVEEAAPAPRKRGLLPPRETADAVEEVASASRLRELMPSPLARGLLPPPVTADAVEEDASTRERQRGLLPIQLAQALREQPAQDLNTVNAGLLPPPVPAGTVEEIAAAPRMRGLLPSQVAAASATQSAPAQGEQRAQDRNADISAAAAPASWKRKRGQLPPPVTADTVEEVEPVLRKRGLLPLPVAGTAEEAAAFEQAGMFQREHYNANNTIANNKIEVDLEARCFVCDGADAGPLNDIVFCDRCDIAVHQQCYGVHTIPQHDYFCRPCAAHIAAGGSADKVYTSSRKGLHELQCVLCSERAPRGGAFTRTDCGSSAWAHVACARWLRLQHSSIKLYSYTVQCAEFLKEAKVPLIACMFCLQSEGRLLRCMARGCQARFHVSCARSSKRCVVDSLTHRQEPA